MIDARAVVAAMARRAELEQAPDFGEGPYLIGSPSACAQLPALAGRSTRLDVLLAAVAELADARHIRDEDEQDAAVIRCLDRVRTVADTWREVL